PVGAVPTPKQRLPNFRYSERHSRPSRHLDASGPVHSDASLSTFEPLPRAAPFFAPDAEAKPGERARLRAADHPLTIASKGVGLLSAEPRARAQLMAQRAPQRSPPMDATSNLNRPFILAAQAQKHVTHNEALRALDAVVQLMVLDKDLSAPPGSPVEGARY